MGELFIDVDLDKMAYMMHCAQFTKAPISHSRQLSRKFDNCIHSTEMFVVPAKPSSYGKAEKQIKY